MTRLAPLALERGPTPGRPSVTLTQSWAQRAVRQLSPSCGVALLSIPAPAVPMWRIAELDPAAVSLFWTPPEPPWFAGLGTALTLRAQGSQRFEEVLGQAERASERFSVFSLQQPGPPLPRFFGGFSFQVGGADSFPWTTFGDARFLLPRLLYTRDGASAWLTLTLAGSELAAAQEDGTGLGDLGRVHDLLVQSALEPAMATPAHTLTVTSSAAPDVRFVRQVEMLRQEIVSGRLEKVVLARRVLLELTARPSLGPVLRRLLRDSPEATSFALCPATSCFLGAAPERLVRKQGLQVHTEALAGSMRRDRPGAAEALLSSRKDRAEHGFVLDAILRALTPECTQVSYSPLPTVRVANRVVHLRTPISGILQSPRHVLRLVERLHPTPAVGGSPTEVALHRISAMEDASRGWYSGPVGWFDLQGDGEFVVALRSALITGQQAILYAGAGIVQSSHPESEWLETELKLETVRSALAGDP